MSYSKSMTPKDEQGSERLTVSLPAKLAGELRYEAQRTNRPVSNIVRDAVQKYVADQPELPLPSFVGIGRSKGASENASERAKELFGKGIEEDYQRQLREFAEDNQARTKRKKPAKP